MREIVKELKKVGNRYYYFSRLQFRSFPIKKSEAEKLLANGEAILLERFITDPEPIKPIPAVEETQGTSFAKSTIIDFASKQRERLDAIRLEQDKQEFINEILPKMTGDEIKKIVSVMNDPEGFRTEMLRIMMRIKVNEV